MKKCWVVIAGLYLYPEFLAAMLPMLLSWTGAALPSAIDEWMTSDYLLAAVLFFIVPTLLLLGAGLIIAVSSLKRPPMSASESAALMKTQMIMRLVQIPGYVLILVVSILFLLFLFTAGFSAYFLILDTASILITGLFSLPVYSSLYRNGLIGRKQAVCYGILSFIFCADVVVSVLCWRQIQAILASADKLFETKKRENLYG